jgi:hypothetical protein
MKRLFTLLSVALTSITVFAQYETRLPLNGNLLLQNLSVNQTQSILTKTQALFPKQFPVVEHFTKTKPDTLFWEASGVTTANNIAIFNAQNNTGATYNNGDGTLGVTDELTSNSINLIAIPDKCYIGFEYEMGETWQAGDSLILQALNAAGNWDNIWRSAPISIKRRNIQFNFLGAALKVILARLLI